MADILNIADYRKYKTPQGVFILRGLFYEETLSDKATVLYTLKDQDHEGYPSLRRLYLEAGDMTEYFFAIKYLSGWAHWERLLECEWFQPYIERWRKELELTVRAKALIRIQLLSERESKESFNANKYLLSGIWKKEPSKVTRDEVKEQAQEEIQKSKEILEDVKRLENL